MTRHSAWLLVGFLAVWSLRGRWSEPEVPRGGEADVAAFGAAGDGFVDDTAAIQRAVDSGAGVVVFPPGVYRLTRPIDVRLAETGYTALRGEGVARLVMEGPGPAIRLVGNHRGTADPGSFDAEIWLRERMPLVDGLSFEGAHPDADGLAADGTMQLTVTRCHFRKLRHGIHLTGNNRNVIISDCHVYHNRGVGIYYDDVNLHQSNITACHISYNEGGGVVSLAGNVRNIHITGCDLEANMGSEGPAANVHIDCRGSRYGTAEVAITGCTIQHHHRGADSANIRIIGASESAGDGTLVREGHVTITGNVLSDVQVNVHLKDCRGVCLTGNTMWMGFRHNLLIESCSHIILGPNNLDRNPRYAYGDAAEAGNGVVLRDCADCTVQGLHLAGVRAEPAALLLERCRRMNVTGCTVLDSEHAAVMLLEVESSRVSDCLLRDDRGETGTVPLIVEGGDDNQFYDVTVRGEPVIR